jgi:hypothetical protein
VHDVDKPTLKQRAAIFKASPNVENSKARRDFLEEIHSQGKAERKCEVFFKEERHGWQAKTGGTNA